MRAAQTMLLVWFSCIYILLLLKNKIHGQNQTDEAGEVIPTEGIGAHEEEGEEGEDREGDDLLQDLELPDGERSAELGRPDAVGGDLETILEEGDAPTQQHDGGQPEAFEPRLEGDVPVPCQRHEGVGDDEQHDGGDSA